MRPFSPPAVIGLWWRPHIHAGNHCLETQTTQDHCQHGWLSVISPYMLTLTAAAATAAGPYRSSWLPCFTGRTLTMMSKQPSPCDEIVAAASVRLYSFRKPTTSARIAPRKRSCMPVGSWLHVLPGMATVNWLCWRLAGSTGPDACWMDRAAWPAATKLTTVMTATSSLDTPNSSCRLSRGIV